MVDPLFNEVARVLGPKVARNKNDDLLGFEMDLEAALAEESLISGVVIERSDADSAITVQAQLAAAAGTLQQLQDALYRTWQRVCYHGFQATSLEWMPDAAELRFMTASTPDLGLTGFIRVGGPHYEKLQRKRR